MRRALSLSLIAALLTAGCASVPTSDPRDDRQAKRFEPPAQDKGALYVYRQGWMGFVKPVEVGIVGGANAQLASNTYLRLEGPPGPIEIGCRSGGSSSSRQFEIVTGETRYVQVAMHPGLWGASCSVDEASPDQGQAAVRAGERVDAL